MQSSQELIDLILVSYFEYRLTKQQLGRNKSVFKSDFQTEFLHGSIQLGDILISIFHACNIDKC